MTRGGKSQQDATELNRPLGHPQNITKIGNWNVRTLHRSGSIAQLAREMTSSNIDIMGISETHNRARKNATDRRTETISYSGRDDENH